MPRISIILVEPKESASRKDIYFKIDTNKSECHGYEFDC